MRIGLPYPLIDEVKPFCRVLRVVVKAGGQEEIVDLSEPERKFRESIKNDRLSTVPFEAKVIKIKPEEQAEIICRVDDLVTTNKLRLRLRGSDADF